MEGTTDNETPGPEEQFGTIEIGNGDVVIYDRDNQDAWLQSDTPVEITV